ncbi:prophage Pi3 protein [Streptococcus gallolyticus]|uniref:Prophage Pi3 protein n=1 Tax=Streptococcus gallolyticus TaxID=315405 RepID=A0AA94M1G1_9STRE|nr:hypothetical protein [Streptococcus gallolyticus]AQP41493.1 hypothetical protein BTR42_02480 [Streptococcus gallolyticus subsp. gallolyticus DSM 16831]SQG78779.1 prophage Pi3 protein [Streptococcus gallolyticus]
MTNLWEETLRKLATYEKTFKDVKYIQGLDFAITKENFEQVAKKTTYDSGYGKSEVAEDLVIVGDGWWLERNEYDGAEWWEYKETPKQINEVKEVNRLAGGIDAGYVLAELNKSTVEK